MQQSDIALAAEEGIALGGSQHHQTVGAPVGRAAVEDLDIVVHRLDGPGGRPVREDIHLIAVRAAIDQQCIGLALPR